jgi:dihydroorotase
LTRNPARILNLEGLGTLQAGATADVTLIDPNRTWNIDVQSFASKSRNSPYHGLPVRGQAKSVILGGVPQEPV